MWYDMLYALDGLHVPLPLQSSAYDINCTAVQSIHLPPTCWECVSFSRSISRRPSLLSSASLSSSPWHQQKLIITGRRLQLLRRSVAMATTGADVTREYDYAMTVQSRCCRFAFFRAHTKTANQSYYSNAAPPVTVWNSTHIDWLVCSKNPHTSAYRS